MTSQNQVRFQTSMFPGAKPYIIVQLLLGVALMMFIIDPQSPWTTGERWVGSIFLWYMIINWSGIMESKSWLVPSEILRIVMTTSLLIYISGNPVSHPLNLVWISISLLSIFWVNLFFRVLVMEKLEE